MRSVSSSEMGSLRELKGKKGEIAKADLYVVNMQYSSLGGVLVTLEITKHMI